MEQIFTVRELIDCWPTRRELAADIGAPTDRVHKWAQSGSIPARYHARVLAAAQRRGFAVTAERIIQMHGVAPTENAA